METYETSTFDRIENSTLGQGITKSFTSKHGESLAYIDYSADGTEASVVIFTPYKGTSRRYADRSIERAEAIVTKHLTKLGYEAPVEERCDLAVAVAVDGDTTVVAQRNADGSVSIVAEQVTKYAPISEEELQQTLDAVTTAGDHHFTESGSIINGLQRIADDIDALPSLCPRCGINTLNVEQPALNARSRYAPIDICPPCSDHESLSKHGFDLWHDKPALVAALDEQRAADAEADAVLQRLAERARQARAERIARETLCEAQLTPAQQSAVRSAAVWPA